MHVYILYIYECINVGVCVCVYLHVNMVQWKPEINSAANRVWTLTEL